MVFGVCGKVFLWAGVCRARGGQGERLAYHIISTANVWSSEPEPGPTPETEGAAVMRMTSSLGVYLEGDIFIK